MNSGSQTIQIDNEDKKSDNDDLHEDVKKMSPKSSGVVKKENLKPIKKLLDENEILEQDRNSIVEKK